MKRRAVACPMPEVAPVTSAIFPVNSLLIISPFHRHQKLTAGLIRQTRASFLLQYALHIALFFGQD
jgi:hypothetical protein